MTDANNPAGVSDVVTEPAGLTAAWLSTALGSPVASVEQEPVGTGQMGASYRLRLTYDDHASGDQPERPRSIVAKLPSPDPARRSMAAGAYLTEVGFYRDLAETIAMRTPTCHYAATADNGAAFVLLLEDLHPARQGDQLRGSTVAEAERAAVSLAGLHGPRWCDPVLLELPWITAIDPEGAAFLGELLTAAVGQFVERYAGRLDPADAELLVPIAAAIEAWMVGRSERFGPVHGDYRMDNLMFFPADDLAVVDWQTVGVGLPARDLAYFLETSLDPEARRACEHAVVARYHNSLLSYGVADYPFDLCFEDYRYGMLQGPLITVLGAAYGTRTDRGDEMFLAMIARSCAAVRDLDTLDLT